MRHTFSRHKLYVVANTGEANITDKVNYKHLALRTFRLLREWKRYPWCSWFVKFDDDTFFFPDVVTNILERARAGQLFTGYQAGARNGIKVPVGGFYAVAAVALPTNYFYTEPHKLQMGEDTYMAFELAKHNVSLSWWYPTRFMSAKHTNVSVADFVNKCMYVVHWAKPAEIQEFVRLRMCAPCACLRGTIANKDSKAWISGRRPRLRPV
jgi:hypothetical protein